MSILRALLTGVLLAAAWPAAAVFRCETNGKIVYQDAACPDGRRMELQQAPPRAEAEQRVAQEKEQLAEIEQEAARRMEAQHKKYARSAKAEAAALKRCEKLATRVSWAAGEAAKAGGKSADKVRRKAERAAQQYDAECAEVETRRRALIGTGG